MTGVSPTLIARLNRRGLRLVMLLDIIGLLAVMVVSMLVRFGTNWPTYPPVAYAISFGIATVIFFAALYFGGLYEREPRLGMQPALPRAARQTLAAGGLVALLNLAASGVLREIGATTTRALPFPIVNLVVLIVLGAAVVAVNRQLVYWRRALRLGPPRLILVGDSDDVTTARDHLDDVADLVTVVGDVANMAALDRHDPDTFSDVMVVTASVVDGTFIDEMTRYEQHGVGVLMRVTGRETLFGLDRVREIGGLPFVVLKSQTLPRSRAQFKRLFDVTLTILAAPLWVPLMAFLIVYQAVFVRHPIFYRQVRVGKDGTHFSMLKFRTMVRDAEKNSGAVLSSATDPRVIGACRWMRATRMDELPQLINVLTGEMSLVGPRPERPELTETFSDTIPGYDRRHETPPGLTGLAQIYGRYRTDAAYKLGYDLQYLATWSPVRDLEILLRTVYIVFTRRI